MALQREQAKEVFNSGDSKLRNEEEEKEEGKKKKKKTRMDQPKLFLVAGGNSHQSHTYNSPPLIQVPREGREKVVKSDGS